MKFLLVHRAPGQDDAVREELRAWIADLERRGALLDGDELRPEAVLVSSANGQLVLTDGPFAETKEYIAGYDLLECDDMTQAVELASRHPNARLGSIEVRPLRRE